MLLPLVLLFIIVPIAELAVIIEVGQQIGVLPTIAILVADSLLGSWLLRSQGRSAWRRFNAALGAGRPPAREVLDGGLIIFGGALLLTPGFITDIVGLVLLVPPSRALVRRFLVRYFGRRFALRVAGPPPRPPTGRGRAQRSRPADGHYDVEGTAVDVEPRDLPR